jgi:hypothetical protein
MMKEIEAVIDAVVDSDHFNVEIGYSLLMRRLADTFLGVINPSARSLHW